jgi:hypothetical protein
LFAALSGWRTVANHLELLPNDQLGREADVVQRNLPWELGSASGQDDATHWTADPPSLRRACAAAVRALVALPADTPSLRLLADGTAEALTGVSRALNGIVLLTDSDQSAPQARRARFRVPDLLPALVNAMRVFIVIGVVELFWIATAWPSGASAVTWSAIFVITLSPAADQAYTSAKRRLVGSSLAVALAAIVKFAVLPGSETFVSLGIAISLVLIPAGALSSLPWQAPMFGAHCVLDNSARRTSEPNHLRLSAILQRGLGDRRRSGQRNTCLPIAATAIAGASVPPTPHSSTSRPAPPRDGADPANARSLGEQRLW